MPDDSIDGPEAGPSQEPNAPNQAEALAAIAEAFSVSSVEAKVREEEGPLHGSQYSSEGEEYLLDSYEQFSYDEHDEQLFSMFDRPVLDDRDDVSSDVDDIINSIVEDQFLVAIIDARTVDSNAARVGSQWVRKSRFPRQRPTRPKAATKPLVIRVVINGLTAIVLLDSGSTTDAVSPEFARVVSIKIFALEDPVPLHLGCRGSRSKIVYGSNARVQVGLLDMNHYLDIVNIDWYDAIIGIGFMREFGIVLDPAANQVLISGVPVPALSEGEEAHAREQRHAMRRDVSRNPSD